MANVDGLISEKELLRYVEELAQLYDWSLYHQVDTGACPHCHQPNFSKRIGPGFPDVVMAHSTGRLIFAELKSQKGVLRNGQAEWLQLRHLHTPEVYLWRPSDMDGIAQILEPGYDAPTGLTLVLPAKYQ